MKVLSRFKKLTRKTVITGVFVIAAIITVSAYSNAQAAAVNLTINTFTDRDDNAVMYNGATSLDTLKHNYEFGVNIAGFYNSASSIHNIYKHFGISSSDINDMGKDTMTKHTFVGEVHKDGTVWVKGQKVATDALTAGRDFMPGSTTVTYHGTTFYERHPDVSFVSNSIAAYVVMENGVFKFAILAACGNPVIAKPVPVYSCSSLNAYPQSNNEFKFTAKASAKGGAEILGYKYNFGDQTNQKVSTTSDINKTSHIYATSNNAHTYQASVAVLVSVNGATPISVTSKTCMVPVKVKPTPTPTATPTPTSTPTPTPTCTPTPTPTPYWQ